jgi:hypothetical protein
MLYRIAPLWSVKKCLTPEVAASDGVGGEDISRYKAIGVKLRRVEEMVAVPHGECRAPLRVNPIHPG